MGDAILATPALRSIREHFGSAKITFLANNIVRQVLSPCDLNDAWLDHGDKNLFTTAKMIKSHNFTHAILFKNSFASALAVFLAGIGIRVGYARDGRGFLLSEKLYPPKTDSGKFKPTSMLDYY
ncbi:MAG: glycosyltransferase family 9 protein, partial [Planctomycetota bacterium]